MDDPANQSQFGKTVALAADQLSGSAAVLLNGRYREGFRMPAQRARPGFYDGCRVENGHIRLFAKEVLTPVQEDQAGHRELT